MPLPVQTSEGSFYNAEIIKESKTRMEFFHKSRNSQKNISLPPTTNLLTKRVNTSQR